MKKLVTTAQLLLCITFAGCGGGGDSGSTAAADIAAVNSGVVDTGGNNNSGNDSGNDGSGDGGTTGGGSTGGGSTGGDTTDGGTTGGGSTGGGSTGGGSTGGGSTGGSTGGGSTGGTPTTSAYVTMEQVIADMSSASEAMVIDPRYGWQSKPAVTMAAPRGDAIPSWWTGNRPTWTSVLQSWFTAFEAQGNAATNSRVQMKDLRIYVLSQSTRTWKLLDKKAAPYTELWSYPFTYAGSNTGSRQESSGGFSLKPSYPNFHHGYGTKTTIVPEDVRAVFAAMDFRLVLDDPNKQDDRAKARYVVDAGGDYYPAPGVNWSLGYAPGVGNGRMLLATPEWRSATLLVPNPNYGSTMQEMRTNPPPLR